MSSQDLSWLSSSHWRAGFTVGHEVSLKGNAIEEGRVT